jgi:nitrate reductase gamma subunit
MWWFTTGGNERLAVPLRSYLGSLHLLPLHFFTQKRYAHCESKRPWLIHLGLMFSYLTMLVLIMFFLRRVQAGPAIDWSVHAFGYAASIGLLASVIYLAVGRIEKTQVHLRHSHESDWIFLGLLLVVTVSGVVQHLLHRTGFELAANVAYVAHLMLVVPMLTLEVPFGKWSHLLYRPFAMYLAATHRDAIARGGALAPGAGTVAMRAA